LKNECGDSFASETEQIISEIESRDQISNKFMQNSKNVRPGQEFRFLIVDSSKWPLGNLDYIISFPKELVNINEEFTQMYEKTKRNKNSSKDQDLGKDNKNT